MAGAVEAKDRPLDQSIRIAKRRIAKALLQILRDFEAAEGLDLPLRSALPDCVSSPKDVIVSKAFDQHADHGAGDPRTGGAAAAKNCAQIGIDVADAVFLRDLREIADPAQLPRLLVAGEIIDEILLEHGKGRMINNEADLRPVFGSLADVVGGCIFPSVWHGIHIVGGKQPLVDAYSGDAGLDRLLVEGIHLLLVVETPRIASGFRQNRIADGVTLPTRRLQNLDRAVHLIHPAG